MKRNTYILSLVLFVFACKGSPDQTTTFFTNFKSGPPLKDWNCLNIDDDRVCVPSTWKLLPQSKYLYYSNINSLDKNNFFVILKYNEIVSGLSDNKYLALTYSALIKDTAEKFTGYTTKKITFANNKHAYYSEYYTSINSKAYLTHSMVFKIDKNLYEFALKSDSASSVKREEVFKDIVFNFQHKNNSMFTSKDEIKDIQVIDLSKL